MLGMIYPFVPWNVFQSTVIYPKKTLGGESTIDLVSADALTLQ